MRISCLSREIGGLPGGAADKELFIPLPEPHPHQVAQVKPPCIPAKNRHSSPWNVCYRVPADDASVPNSAGPMSVTSCRLGLVMCECKMHCSRIGRRLDC